MTNKASDLSCCLLEPISPCSLSSPTCLFALPQTHRGHVSLWSGTCCSSCPEGSSDNGMIHSRTSSHSLQILNYFLFKIIRLLIKEIFSMQWTLWEHEDGCDMASALQTLGFWGRFPREGDPSDESQEKKRS